MLTQKNKELPYISIFKIQTGEEFIAKVTDETMMGFTVSKPLCMVPAEKGMQFAPLLMMADLDKPMWLSKNNVVVTAPPQTKLAASYEEATSPIVRLK